MFRKRQDLGLTWLPTIEVDETGLPEGYAEWLLQTVQLGKPQVAEIHASHAQALEIVQAYARELEPFGLYLRSFDIEALRAPSIRRWHGKDVSFVEFINPPSAVERILVNELQPALPVIAVTHPAKRFVPPGLEFLPRLLLGDDWRDEVSALVQHASIVVVEVAKISPGLLEELDLLVATGAQAHSVIVLDDSSSEGAEQLRFQAELVGRVAAESLSRSDRTISRFARVIGVNEFTTTRLDQTVQFADLLSSVRLERGLDEDGRVARRDALALAVDATRLALAGQLQVAAFSDLLALEAFAALDDTLSILGLSANLAFIAAGLDDREKVRDCVKWIIDASSGLSPVELAGALLRFELLGNLPTDDADQQRELTRLFGA